MTRNELLNIKEGDYIIYNSLQMQVEGMMKVQKIRHGDRFPIALHLDGRILVFSPEEIVKRINKLHGEMLDEIL